MESEQHLSPAAALAAADQARSKVANSVIYPPGYVAGTATSAAMLFAGLGVATTDEPTGALRVLLSLAGVLGFCGVFGWLWLFEHRNRARVTGYRFIRHTTWAYIAAMGVMGVGVSMSTEATNDWWIGLVAAPVAAALTALYLRRWLAAYRRHHA